MDTSNYPRQSNYPNQYNQQIQKSSNKKWIWISLISVFVTILIIGGILFFIFLKGEKTGELDIEENKITKKNLIQGITTDLKEDDFVWWYGEKEGEDNWKHGIVFEKTYPKERYYSKIYEDDSDVIRFGINSGIGSFEEGGGSFRLKNIYLAIGDEKKIDYGKQMFNQDNYFYNLKIKLISIDNNTAKIYFKEINEPYCDCSSKNMCNLEIGKCVECIVETDCKSENEFCFENSCQTIAEINNRYTTGSLGESHICNDLPCENCREKSYKNVLVTNRLFACVECNEEKDCIKGYKCENHECISK